MPQNFYTSSGDGGFDPKQRKVRCLQPEEVKADVMGAAEYRNNISLAVLADADVDVVRAWEMLRDLPQLHPQEGLKGQVDCAHWCETANGPMAALAHILLSEVAHRYWDGVSR
mmetsp:Transcript_29308/g.75236  ORF Transcript_29308/g.75236 Transcript_29308/m.75236 type:complete len:113 (+) Transcript_29308:1715-2053(+)|eukprot:jgi/Tetstr1/456601/TSEL_043304.t1